MAFGGAAALALKFRQSAPEDLGALLPFLMSAFEAGPEAWFVDPALAQWKFFETRPDWEGSRSYVLEQNSQILAHGCVHPLLFATPRGDITGAQVIDWASSRKLNGGGVLLLRKIAAMVDVLVAVGGSAQTRAILPRIGYRQVGELESFARVVRPFRMVLTRPFKGGLKAPLRLARNLMPNWHPKRAIGVYARFTAAVRTPEVLEYMAQCPRAAVAWFPIGKKGYFVLSRVRGQTRIADLHIDCEDPSEWRAAYAQAVRAAAADPATCEIAAAAAVPLLKWALEQNGFRPRWKEPVFLFDPKGRLADATPLSIQLADNDAFYTDDPAFPYLSW